MFNAICYHYKISNDDICNLTIHQFNSKIEFLNKMFSDKPDNSTSQNGSVSNPFNKAILDNAFGVK